MGIFSVFGIEKCFKFQKQKYFSFCLSVLRHTLLSVDIYKTKFSTFYPPNHPCSSFFFDFVLNIKLFKKLGEEEDENNLKNLFLPSFIQSLSVSLSAAAAAVYAYILLFEKL